MRSRYEDIDDESREWSLGDSSLQKDRQFKKLGKTGER